MALLSAVMTGERRKREKSALSPIRRETSDSDVSTDANWFSLSARSNSADAYGRAIWVSTEFCAANAATPSRLPARFAALFLWETRAVADACSCLEKGTSGDPFKVALALAQGLARLARLGGAIQMRRKCRRLRADPQGRSLQWSDLRRGGHGELRPNGRQRKPADPVHQSTHAGDCATARSSGRHMTSGRSAATGGRSC